PLAAPGGTPATGRRAAGTAAYRPSARAEGASRRLGRARRCYACRAPFREAHFFYDSLCPPCAAHNFAKRVQTASLRGRVALVTGARITSGYETALKLLRAGATVIGTTRFPRDAAERFGAERDFGSWSRRLHLYGLDFRVPGWVEAFAEHVAASFDRLDVLVNNAAQTVRRPAPFYAHLVPGECAPAGDVDPRLRPALAANRDFAAGLARGRGRGERAGLSALLSQAPVLPDDVAALGPAGGPAIVGAGVDAREANSWAQRLGEVAGAECLEALLVNAAAPFLLSGRLRPLMARDALAAKWVVNVAAVEGQFSRRQKDDRHPHLNMAKAALNMLTRSAADGFARDRIFMNSVDVGWFSNGEP
ncbi:MAG TPA: SDR family NAD(P)-dependent oxidoreductase, partial [Polyangiaceae bacterium]|nr:SDR family NAD(P)-dependent oxidoreductase [Polyangiaceae bacterium]